MSVTEDLWLNDIEMAADFDALDGRIRADEGRMQIYLLARTRGESHRFAEMCALQQPPGSRGTERALMQGWNTDPVPGVPDFMKKMYIDKARAAGIPVSGRVYMSGLADKRGAADPSAWVQGLDDVRDVAKRRNLTVTGAVNIQGTISEPAPAKKLGEDIIQRHMKEALAHNPHQDKSQLREHIIDTHAPKWETP